MKLSLRPEDYDRIDQVVQLKGDEFYSVVSSRVRGRVVRSVHVFDRMPTQKEMMDYEDRVSRITMKGQRTNFEGSQLSGAKFLYDRLINRAYDVPVGSKRLGELTLGKDGKLTGAPLSPEQAREQVPVLIKREAVRDALGAHFSESAAIEADGTEEEASSLVEGD